MSNLCPNCGYQSYDKAELICPHCNSSMEKLDFDDELVKKDDTYPEKVMKDVDEVIGPLPDENLDLEKDEM